MRRRTCSHAVNIDSSAVDVLGNSLGAVFQSDALEALAVFRSRGLGSAVDLVVADPPYFLGKADWDGRRSHHETLLFHETWIEECRDLLTPDGSMWVSGGDQGIYAIGHLMQRMGMEIISSVVWQKPAPLPLRNPTKFKHAHELLIYAKRSKATRPYFDYGTMRAINGGLAPMSTVWAIPSARPWEKRHGRHPTQKPERLIERIVLATCPPGGLVLDPFVGSGTTAAVAIRHGRKVIGIDSNEEYIAIARKRVADELNTGPATTGEVAA